MDSKYLERWVESPIPGRRQKAIYKLGKLTAHGKYNKEKLFPKITKLLKDEHWQVRATAISIIADLAEVVSLPRDLVEVLFEIALNDSHPNVRANAMIALGKIYEVTSQSEILKTENIIKLINNGIKSENNDIKHASIYLISKIGVKNFNSIKEPINTLLDDYSKMPALLRKEFLSAIRSIYLKNPEEAKDLFLKTLEYYREEDVYYVVEEILKNMAIALERGLIEANEDLRNYIKKKLRFNNKVSVILAALNVLESIIKGDISTIDEYLGILTNELLLKIKNKAVKINVLKFLERNIDKIPQEIIYKYELPRVLDIIDMNTIPKNRELAQIKNLARHILEDKLGYNFELRQKLRKE